MKKKKSIRGKNDHTDKLFVIDEANIDHSDNING